jgi:hypothetical protein
MLVVYEVAVHVGSVHSVRKKYGVCIGIVGMNSRGVLGKTLGSELLYLHTDG